MSFHRDPDDAARPTSVPDLPPMAYRGSPTGPPGRPPREPLSWPVVMGFGGLALLHPLAELSGVSDALGRAPTLPLVAGLVAGAPGSPVWGSAEYRGRCSP